MENKIDKLADILKRLNNNEDPDSVKNEARELIEDLTAEELSLAEQKLVDEGIEAEELRSLCSVHIEMLEGQLNDLKASLPHDHVLNTFIEEHDEILKLLDKLEQLNNKIQKMKSNEESAAIFSDLKNTAEGILNAEKHHKREEDVLFPELENLGITGPTRIMRLEHDEIRLRKRMLVELSNSVNFLDFTDFKNRVNELSNYIVFNMRDHIFKENYILYPTAYEAIADDNLWNDMKKRCDEIGYCPFTPLK
ncbi:histidine kinase [Thermoanaerobacterium thermosaccharolyticum]|uniref:Histidine kinase n=1 Tax=Thermoanaerobacterium thermosaccharolyticum TaxID=1517 RepID=A0A231VMW1_THETR|nr:DUF438 domain-containing protein [Thermoanaerobacterium thermosaccharolyticum]AST58090.1 histidine kinase [Thermoanaerobacterium thermosaccharolyticum]MBE0068576.1 DUF438 domain-containing protein [Thermoanaerobacterium thermosaccharolyticum]MBE0228591.1 DUF438 domain-containing protein [Thermoanaerobacterium thermosaccharolyticum]MCP2240268.1 DUF438 domain-containing protein [Thermoanaerobacterium thermosaccharolyticum]OXT09414.1 hypothetical protein CE561_00960 [Thermoanaerobacterium ther